ncbi:unnamed protein product [Polarella glacialis]|uniref:Uncharacterized protein n=1 Tax=Polarella glacialis TaxID=89957 RepID=A0A813KTW8_POLGL|nr:unnamed protein product [Polarella glacialis]
MASESVDLLGAGITSLAEIPGHQEGDCAESSKAPRTRTLNLHMNRLRSLEGLDIFVRLEELVLSANSIAELRGSDFSPLKNLRVLDLSCNELRRLSGLQGLVSLQQLRLAYNKLETLEGAQQLWGRRYQLQLLDLRRNSICSVQQLLFLGGLCCLSELLLTEGSEGAAGNPVCNEPGYREAALCAVPWLLALDGLAVSDGDKCQASEAAANCPLSADVAKVSAAAATASAAKELRAETKRRQRQQALQEEVRQATAELREATERVDTENRLCRAAEEALKEAEAAAESQAAACEVEASREAQLRADLAEIAVAVRRREETYEQRSEQLREMGAALPAAFESRHAEEEALAAECLRNLSLTSELRREEESAREALAQEQDAEAALACWRSEAGPWAAADTLKSLQQELLRCEQELEDARVQLRGKAAAARGSEEVFVGLRQQVAASEHREAALRSHVRAEDSAARSRSLEAAEQAGRLASLRKTSAEQLREGRVELLAATAAAHEARERLSRWRAEASLREAKVAALLGTGAGSQTPASSSSCLPRHQLDSSCAGAEAALRERQQQLRLRLEQERLRSLSGFEPAEALAPALRSRLQGALQQAEDAVGGSRLRLGTAEAKLEQQRKAARLADEQEGLGSFVTSELQLELARSRCEEMRSLQEGEEATAAAAAEGSCAERLQREALLAERGAEAIQLHYSSLAHEVPLAIHSSCCQAAAEAAAETSILSRRDVQLRAEVAEQVGALRLRGEELQSLRATIASCAARGEETQQKLRVKKQMVVHARMQLEDVRCGMRKAGKEQQERDVAWRDRLAEASGAAETRVEEAESLREASKATEEEVARFARIATQKGEAASFAEGQLLQLQQLRADELSRMEDKVQDLRAEGQRVLREAQLAAAEMEQRFRSEREVQLQQQRAMRLELESLQEELRGAPASLEAVRRRVSEERASSARRAAVLLAALGGVPAVPASTT